MDNVKQGAKSVKEALVASTVPLKPEEVAALDNDGPSLAPHLPPNPQPVTGVPEWFTMPPGMELPEGRQVSFLRFRAEWTDTPHKGDRVCMMWNLSAQDERLALKRTRGDSQRTLTEMAKQTIRAMDGHKADWTRGDASNVEIFWEEIGARCRQLLTSLYLKTHSLTDEETADFFTNCLTVRTTG